MSTVDRLVIEAQGDSILDLEHRLVAYRALSQAAVDELVALRRELTVALKANEALREEIRRYFLMRIEP